MTRMSRLAMKERLREIIEETLDEVSGQLVRDPDLITDEGFERDALADAVWEYLTQEDSSDLAGSAELSDETEE